LTQTPVSDFQSLHASIDIGRIINHIEKFSVSAMIKEATLENHILKTFKYVQVKFEKITDAEPHKLQNIFDDPIFIEMETASSNLIIQEYSEKAIVLRGDTKPIKDQLKELGGSFNFKLKGGPGWIFSKKREAEIKKIFNL
jgi:hypothetical protein